MEPPPRQIAADDAEPVVPAEARVLLAPVAADHLAAACDREHACLGAGRELREEAHEIGGSRDEAGGGGEGVGRRHALMQESAAERPFAALPLYATFQD